MFGFLRRSRRIRQLEQALGWYADESHWRRKATNSKGSPRRWEKSPAARDRGARARTALGLSWASRLWNDVLNRHPSWLVKALTPTPASPKRVAPLSEFAKSARPSEVMPLTPEPGAQPATPTTH